MSKRIHIEFERDFSADSDNGKAFGWLKENMPEYAYAITNLVRMTYLPLALAESGASPETVERAIQRAREFFESKMLLALGTCQTISTSPDPSPSLVGLSAGTEGVAEKYPVMKLTLDEDF